MTPPRSATGAGGGGGGGALAFTIRLPVTMMSVPLYETPSSTGKNIELTITSDGKYSIHTNGVLTSDGSYVLVTRKCIHDATDKSFINFSSGVGLMVEKVDNETLEVSDEAHDGLGSIYKRKSLNGN